MNNMRIKACVLFLALLYGVGAQVCGQTDLYAAYSHRMDLSVACVLDYKLDGRQTIDVAMLQARDSASWQSLAADFELDTVPSLLEGTLARGGEVLLTRYSVRSNPQRPLPMVDGTVDVNNGCFVGVAYRERTIWVFYYRDAAQLDFLLDHLSLNEKESCGKNEQSGSLFFCFDESQPQESLLFGAINARKP